jgi:hypothetical protein
MYQVSYKLNGEILQQGDFEDRGEALVALYNCVQLFQRDGIAHACQEYKKFDDYFGERWERHREINGKLVSETAIFVREEKRQQS